MITVGMEKFMYFLMTRSLLSKGFVLLAGCVLLACASSVVVTDSEEHHFVRFRTVSKVPVISARINGKVAWFLVDTGASISVLNASDAKYFGFVVIDDFYHQKTQVNGFGGRSDIYSVSNCDVALGNLKLKYIAWKTRDMRTLFSTMLEGESLDITGILGSDVLTRYGITIHYDKRMLSYKIPRRSFNNSLGELVQATDDPAPAVNP